MPEVDPTCQRGSSQTGDGQNLCYLKITSSISL